MAWNYAELSKLAKENGGPEKLVNILVDSGKKSVYPWLGVAFAGGVALTIGIQKVVQHLKEQYAVSPQAVETAKQELIQGIKDYDKEQQSYELTQKEDETDEQT